MSPISIILAIKCHQNCRIRYNNLRSFKWKWSNGSFEIYIIKYLSNFTTYKLVVDKDDKFYSIHEYIVCGFLVFFHIHLGRAASRCCSHIFIGKISSETLLIYYKNYNIILVQREVLSSVSALIHSLCLRVCSFSQHILDCNDLLFEPEVNQLALRKPFLTCDYSIWQSLCL